MFRGRGKRWSVLVAAAALLAMAGGPIRALADQQSTPQKPSTPAPSGGTPSPAQKQLLSGMVLPTPIGSPAIGQGLNIQLSQEDAVNGSGFFPPDTMGAVGPN